MFEFGFAKEDITPSYGIPLCGYFNPRPNRGALDPLTIKAAVFRSGKTRTAVISYDLCLLSGEFVQRLIDTLKKAGVAFAENILFSATHTHTGPYTTALFGDHADPGYLDMVVAKTVSAVQRAVASLAPAELLATKTECTTLAFNRRYWMKNGVVLTNPGKLNPQIDRPEGATDPSIPLLAIRQEGFYRLLLANIVNHTDTIGGDYVSADWPGRMEHEIQARLGYDVPVITMIGAQGNINHFNTATAADQTSYLEATRIGKTYAAVILAALYQLNEVKVKAIRAAVTTLEVPYVTVTDAEYAEARKTVEKFRDAVMEDGRDFTSEDIAKKHPFVLRFFAENLMKCRDEACKNKRVEKMVALQFGDAIGVVSIPAEPFTEIGLGIKAASRFPLTLVAGLSMGEVGYVGLPEHYCHGGGYETSPSPEKADRLAGQNMMNTAIELLNR